jgi:predicted acylesterase/phospholipase RssA
MVDPEPSAATLQEPTDVVSPPPDGLAMPRDFGAGYGEGLDFGLSLGGGGLFFVAWQAAYLATLAERDIDLGGAQRVVGTSAGSLVASVLEAGNLGTSSSWPPTPTRPRFAASATPPSPPRPRARR